MRKIIVAAALLVWAPLALEAQGYLRMRNAISLPPTCAPENFELIRLTVGNTGLYACNQANVWSRIDISGVLDVKAFGARGDGVRDDTSAIQTAVTAAGIIAGTVFFPRGTYLVTKAIALGSNVTLRGNGTQATILSTKSAVTIVNAGDPSLHDCRIENMQFAGGGAATWAIVMGNTAGGGLAYNNGISNIVIAGCNSGIGLGNMFYSAVSNVKLIGTDLAAGQGIYVWRGASNAFSNVQIGNFGWGLYYQETGSNVWTAGALYADAGMANTVHLARLDDAYHNTFVGALFECLANLAISEVVVNTTAAGIFFATGNRFIGCDWNGTNGAAHTHLLLTGVGGNRAGNTLVEACTFIENAGVPVDIAFTSSQYTVVLQSRAITGYSGADITAPSTTGADVLAPTVNGQLLLASTTVAALGAPANGAVVYCSDCAVGAVCAGGGAGALAKRIAGAWVCN